MEKLELIGKKKIDDIKTDYLYKTSYGKKLISYVNGVKLSEGSVDHNDEVIDIKDYHNVKDLYKLDPLNSLRYIIKDNLFDKDKYEIYNTPLGVHIYQKKKGIHLDVNLALNSKYHTGFEPRRVETKYGKKPLMGLNKDEAIDTHKIRKSLREWFWGL